MAQNFDNKIAKIKIKINKLRNKPIYSYSDKLDLVNYLNKLATLLIQKKGGNLFTVFIV